MSAAAARAALRPSRFAIRHTPARNASTTSETASSAASKAKETASNVTSKASEGLTRVQESAGSVASSAGSAASTAAAGVQGRVGRLVSTVQSLIPPTVYYSKVGLELGKLVVHGQKMAPPNMAQFQSYFSPLINAARNPSSILSQNPSLLQPQQYLNQVRNISRQQMVTAGVVTAEVLGFFTIGEMIGRAKIVGYRGAVVSEHH